MTASRDPDSLIHDFIREGEDVLHDQIYDAVRAAIEQQRQRAAFGPWRAPTMNKFLTIGLGAAAVVVLLVIGLQLLGSRGAGFGDAPSASPSASHAEPTPTPEPTAPSEPSPSTASAPPLTQSFTSTLHGISMSYPEGWTAQAATEPWTDRTFPLLFGEPHADFLYDPTLESDLFLTIASQPIGDSTPEDWVAEQMASEEGCGAATEPIAVDGATGLIGAECTVVVVTTAGRGYWIQLYTSGDDELAVAAYDGAWFEEFLATVQLQPEEAAD
jgi:hypothetical protein